MSYIDCFKHELVGYLNGLPIYHPLEGFIGGKFGDSDFSCTSDNLVIGGGGGEHPALVLHNLSSLVASYLYLAIEKRKEYWPELEFFIPDDIEKVLDDIFDEKADLEFCDWSMKQHSEFYINAQSPLHQHPLKRGECAEEWIEDSIGEFIYYSLPELIPIKHKEIFDYFRSLEIGFWMGNVVCPPPNYIKTRQQSIDDNNWPEVGHFRWEYKVG